MRARLTLLAGVLSVIVSCAGCQAGGVEPDGGRAAVVPAELMARAKQDGWVRVIVNLRVPSGSTEAAVRAAREAVVAVLGPASYRIVREYATIPAVALVVSADALNRLARSPHVTSVQADMPLEPKR